MSYYYHYDYDWQDFLRWFGKLSERLKEVLSAELDFERSKIYREFIKPENRSDVLDYLFEKRGKYQWFGLTLVRWPTIKIKRRKVDLGKPAVEKESEPAEEAEPDLEQIKQKAFREGQQSVGQTNALKWVLILFLAFIVIPGVFFYLGQYFLIYRLPYCLELNPHAAHAESLGQITGFFLRCLVTGSG